MVMKGTVPAKIKITMLLVLLVINFVMVMLIWLIADYGD